MYSCILLATHSSVVLHCDQDQVAILTAKRYACHISSTYKLFSALLPNLLYRTCRSLLSSIYYMGFRLSNPGRFPYCFQLLTCVHHPANMATLWAGTTGSFPQSTVKKTAPDATNINLFLLFSCDHLCV